MAPSRSEMDTGTIAAIIGGIVAVLTALITQAYQHLSGAKKATADAQLTAVSGFISLISQLQAERLLMIARITECEAKDQKQDRRISQLERCLTLHGIDIPGDGP
jgi:hypothetical protein